MAMPERLRPVLTKSGARPELRVMAGSIAAVRRNYAHIIFAAEIRRLVSETAGGRCPLTDLRKKLESFLAKPIRC